jgi:hydrogenase expression/formation protein HypC
MLLKGIMSHKIAQYLTSVNTMSFWLKALVCITGELRLKYMAMCLAVPVKIVSLDGDEAETEIAGVRRRVSIAFTPEAKVGDYVLLHTGYAITVIDEAEAEETLKLLEEIASLSEVH